MASQGRMGFHKPPFGKPALSCLHFTKSCRVFHFILGAYYLFLLESDLDWKIQTAPDLIFFLPNIFNFKNYETSIFRLCTSGKFKQYPTCNIFSYVNLQIWSICSLKP